MRLRPALMLSLLFATPAAAEETPQPMPAWITPGRSGQEAVPALLTLPARWSVGDAGVIVAAPRTAMPARLVELLVEQDAAVLELPLPPAQDAGPLLAAAVRNLATQQGAGLVVVIGFGASAAAALRDAPAGAGLAAVISVQDDAVEPRLAQHPAPEQGWAARAPLLCATLARALPLNPAGCTAALLR